jgi:hypothetical protein
MKNQGDLLNSFDPIFLLEKIRIYMAQHVRMTTTTRDWGSVVKLWQ